MSRLTEITAYHLRVPLSRPLTLGEMHIENREYVFVCLVDENGNQGTALGHARNAPVADVIERCVKPFWIEGDLEDHERMYQRAVKANVCLGTNGLFWRALSLVDCALFDLLAQQQNQSLSDYLGGGENKASQLIVGGYPLQDETEKSLAREMEVIAQYSPDGVKIASCGDLSRDTQRLKVCRRHLPAETPLMIDCYWSYNDCKEILRQTRTWHDLNIGWIEDPLAFDDYEGIACLCREASIPVAVGDEQSGVRAFKRLLEAGVQILRLDATVCGGVRSFLEIARLAQEYDRPVACHVFQNLHEQLARVTTNTRWVENMLAESDIEVIHKLQNDTGVWNPLKNNDSHRATLGVGYEWNNSRLSEYAIS